MKSLIPAVYLFIALTAAAGSFQDPGKSRSDDGRMATVTDVQGTALVRPVGRARWSRLRPRSVLVSGDQVRTPGRGAHAAELALPGGGSVVLGPGTLVELPASPANSVTGLPQLRRALRLLRGDVEVKGSAANAVICSGPGDYRQSIESTVVLRARDRATTVLSEPPRWLTGYRTSTTDEWMGSLLATVDGRDVPLSVGYHSVNAVIRDQIAQTTVEQSFVNSTKERLEGVFYFPLPAGASISGFGMWIGDELVEADIVEKQRARAIYEDILRRKKDPGLLEWSGGNLFKARVFPIEPHSEKRIRLRYTQVLPLEGSTLRYRYALRSELLRSNPLRRLQLKVSVFSGTKIKAAASPTHEVRSRNTDRAATIEFDAESYSPDRDFEAVVTLAPGKPLVATSHRRGEDGYLMLQLSPPGDAASPWQRDLLPDGEALDVLVMADTSGSMDEAARGAQAAFIGGLLEVLGDEDRFRLMACDVGVKWFRDEATGVTEGVVADVLDFLARRPSLGWTDLDLAFAEATERAGENALVIYVGDGIGTTGDADPVATAQRLERLQTKGAVFHSVSTGSTYEQAVLEAIARLGGGSTRASGDDPAQTAYGLLAEVAQPALSDVSVEIRGIRTARVYPERLPRLAAGKQQIVLGRYLPEDGVDRGEVIVTGTRAGERVRFTAPISIERDESGNSFLPRLWARRHLDALLAKGRSAEVQAEIVAFSQRFEIITPFTSFLVLENDQERERYGVTRRVKMRDGELFFASARDAASTEVLRQQMKEARGWRLRLRAQMLREIAGLGEDLPLVAANQDEPEGAFDSYGWNSAIGLGGGAGGKFGARYGGRKGGGEPKLQESEMRLGMLGMPEESFGDTEEVVEEAEPEAFYANSLAAPGAPAGELRSMEKMVSGSSSFYLQGPSTPGPTYRGRRRSTSPGSYNRPAAPPDLGFPGLEGPPAAPVALPDPGWDPEILALVRQLDRRPRLAALTGGLKLRARADWVHALHGQTLNWRATEGIVMPGEWLVRAAERGSQTHESWSTSGQRGVVATALRLGRRRPSVKGDADRFDFPLADLSLENLARRYRQYSARIASRSGAMVVVVLSTPWPSRSELELTIDTQKKILAGLRTLDDGRATSTVAFRGAVEFGGQWWATTMDRRDEDGRVVWRMRLDVSALDTEQATSALRAAVSNHDDVLFVAHERADLEAAKQEAHDGTADLAQHLRLVEHWASTQQWDRAAKAWEAASDVVSGKPGGPWIHTVLLSHSRRGEEFRASLLQLATGLGEESSASSVFLAERLTSLAGRVLDVRERLVLHDAVAGVFDSEGADSDWLRTRWQQRRALLLAAQGRRAEALELRASIARDHPGDIDAVAAHMKALFTAGRSAEVARRAEALLANGDVWLPAEADQIFTTWSDALWRERRLSDLLAALERWVGRPTTADVAYVRYLTVLIFAGREADADRWMKASMAEEFVPRDQAQMARLRGTIRMAMGRGWGFWASELPERWQAPLGALARRLVAADGDHGSLAANIFSDYRFRRTDAHAKLLEGLLEDFLVPGAIESMDPIRVARYVERIPWGRTQIDASTWRSAVDRLHAKWKAIDDARARHSLAASVLSVLDAHAEKDEALEFLAGWLASASETHRPGVAEQLFGRLAAGDWTQGAESRLFELLPLLEREGQGEPERRRMAATKIRDLAKKLYAGRLKSELGPVEELEQLPRVERRAREQSARQTVRAALKDSFSTQATGSQALRRLWLKIEALGFAVQVGEDLEAVETGAAKLLSEIPADPEDPVWRVLRERASLVMTYAATRREAPEGLGDGVLARYLARRSEGEQLLDWSYQVFRLLVALDRPADLETELRKWIVPGRLVSNWRIALGYLLAERGRIAEAVTWFEQVASDDELGPGDYAVLSSWHLVLGDDEKRDAARIGRFRAMSTGDLQSRLRRDVRSQSRSGDSIAEPLDPDTLLALRSLLSKATRPDWHIGQMQQLYKSTKDVRVLASLADGVIGHSAQAAYQFLESSAQIVREVHEEATCDALMARLGELEASAKTATDRRALGLLRASVERRAGQVLDNPGPHLSNGVAAMVAAFEGEFRPGEGLRYSSYLASLGRMGEPRYGEEQLRQLGVLLSRHGGGSAGHLQGALHLARTRWAYGEHALATDILGAALRERRGTLRGALPQTANNAVQVLINWLKARRSFGVAERFLQSELAAQADASQLRWYRNRLHQTYTTCLQFDGVVSLGRGRDLYHALSARFEKAMWSCAGDQVGEIVSDFCRLHRVAYELVGKSKIRSAAGDLARFARDRLPEVFTRMVTDSDDAALNVARALRALDEPRAALELLVTRAEREPSWHRRVRADIWRTAKSEMALLRSVTPDLGPLGERLLVVASRELEHALRTNSSFKQPMFHRSPKYFWAEETAAFAAAAHRVVSASSDHPARLLFAARYLWEGLGLRDEAVKSLADANARGVLNDGGRFKLVNWLHAQRRYRESLPVIAALAAKRPDSLGYRTALIVALHETDKDDEAARQVDDTVARFKERGHWNEHVLAALARACLSAELYERSVSFYDELIPLHERSRRNHEKLARYYGEAARAYLGLGKTAQAVDRASSAVVAWGPQRDQRRKAIEVLRDVLSGAEDLGGFVAGRDAAAASSGLDSPLLRKLLGLVYLDRGEGAAAIAQLRLARDLDPLDTETHQALVVAHDRVGDPRGAMAALRTAVRVSPMDLALYTALAGRLADLGLGEEAERAWTSVVEVKPNEAEGHRLLAQHREEQERYPDAVTQWQQVVRVRTDEPDGWLSLAQAQIKATRRDEARRTLRLVLSKTWHKRFGDVGKRASELLRGL